jgi:predicted nucleotidyltransferase
MKPEQVQEFLADLTMWAWAQQDIEAVALVGSYARNAATPTSDVDVVILAQEPRLYLQDQTWLQRFGTIRTQQVEYYGLVTSLRVFYTNGLEVEFGVTSVRWAAAPLDEGTRQVIAGGMRILFERSPILSRHLPLARP